MSGSGFTTLHTFQINILFIYFYLKKIGVCLLFPLMTEKLKLTIFTYKWGKCVKPVGKYLLESLIK